MQSWGDLVDRSMVRRLCLFLLGVDILLPRPVVTIALVSRSSAAAYQQLASAECGGSFPMVPLSMACGAQPFPVSLLVHVGFLFKYLIYKILIGIIVYYYKFLCQVWKAIAVNYPFFFIVTVDLLQGDILVASV